MRDPEIPSAGARRPRFDLTAHYPVEPGDLIDLTELDLNRRPHASMMRIEDIHLEDLLIEHRAHLRHLEVLNDCVIPLEDVISGRPSVGFFSSWDHDSLLKAWKTPGAQFLSIVDPKGIEGGGLIYLTSGEPSSDDREIAEEVEKKLNLPPDLKIAWTLDAWIRKDLRVPALYAEATGRMFEEIFDKHCCDMVLAYVRVNPSANGAIRAHQEVGWELLQYEGKPFIVKVAAQLPTLAEWYGTQEEKDLERLVRASKVAENGMELQMLCCTRERWESGLRDRLMQKRVSFHDMDPTS